MFSMRNRGRLDQPVQEEFEHLFAKLRGFLSQSFDEDGHLIVADANFAVVPVGGVLGFAGTVMPQAYLRCNGAAVSRVTYLQLFSVIGVTYGAGDGTTTFNVPNLPPIPPSTTVQYLIYAGVFDEARLRAEQQRRF